MQGSLIYTLLGKPIYFDSITLSDVEYCNVDAVNRAIRLRFLDASSTFSPAYQFRINQPIVQMSNKWFSYKKNIQLQLQPAASSIVWCKTQNNPHQVAVNGKRLGVTKKTENTSSGRLNISKIELFRCYMDILHKMNQKFNLYPLHVNLTSLYYCDAKDAAIEYQRVWNEMKQNYFPVWTVKPQKSNKFSID